jgi:hypothetical protein
MGVRLKQGPAYKALACKRDIFPANTVRVIGVSSANGESVKCRTEVEKDATS